MPITRATIPQQTFMIYQLMFAIITPALISGRVRRAHEILRHAAVHDAVVAVRLLPDGAHGVGQGRIAERHAGRKDSRASISPAARWCTSPPAFRRWCARCIWASAKAIRSEPMRPHSLVLSVDRRVPAVGGLVRIQRRQRAGGIVARHQRVRRDAFRRGRGGARLDGRRMDRRPASPACWARSPARSPDWSRSRPLRDS